MSKRVSLREYNKQNYNPGSFIKRIFWFFLSLVFFETKLPWNCIFKQHVLRFFGARVGKRVCIKPNVKIKYPWFLSVGDDVWIGEGVWIDNLAQVTIGDNVCISQGAYLCTGNHDFKKQSFDLIVKSIELHDGVWIGAKAIVSPGVICGNHSLLCIGSVATQNLSEYSINQGNPATMIKKREIGL